MNRRLLSGLDLRKCHTYNIRKRIFMHSTVQVTVTSFLLDLEPHEEYLSFQAFGI